MNLTSKSALKDENKNETIIEGLKAKLQNMKQFLSTITKDFTNNIKKRIPSFIGCAYPDRKIQLLVYY